MINTVIDHNVINKVVEQFGTPVLCFEHDEIEKYVGKMLHILPTAASLVYSVKAGPNPYIIRYLFNHGGYFETASEGELMYLLSLRVPASKIIVSGQGKTKEYIELAISNGVTKFNLESENEIKMLSVYKKDNNLNCSIRINPNFSNNRSVLKMGGVPSAYGIDENQLDRILSKDTENVLNGIFMYAGSQFFHAEDIIYNTEYLLNKCVEIYNKTGRQFEYFDFGGGFGVPEDDIDGELDMELLSDSLSKLFDSYLYGDAFKKTKNMFFESGRYISARTAALIIKVLDIKESWGQKFLITDMGINSLGVKQHDYRIYPPVVKQLITNDTIEEYTVVGRTCTPIDETHPKCQLSKVNVGDILYIPDCGAYSLTFSPNNFCGLRRVQEVVHKEGFFLVTNRTESWDEVYGRTVIYKNIEQGEKWC